MGLYNGKQGPVNALKLYQDWKRSNQVLFRVEQGIDYFVASLAMDRIYFHLRSGVSLSPNRRPPERITVHHDR